MHRTRRGLVNGQGSVRLLALLGGRGASATLCSPAVLSRGAVGGGVGAGALGGGRRVCGTQRSGILQGAGRLRHFKAPARGRNVPQQPLAPQGPPCGAHTARATGGRQQQRWRCAHARADRRRGGSSSSAASTLARVSGGAAAAAVLHARSRRPQGGRQQQRGCAHARAGHRGGGSSSGAARTLAQAAGGVAAAVAQRARSRGPQGGRQQLPMHM
jgi:hypothetical protein